MMEKPRVGNEVDPMEPERPQERFLYNAFDLRQ